MTREQTLAQVKKLADIGEVEAAWNMVEQLMLQNPNDGLAVMMGAYTMDKAKRIALAYPLAKHATTLEQFGAIEQRIRSYLSVIDDRLIE